MVLYFENNCGKMRRIGKIDGRMSSVAVRKEVFRQINQFCNERGFNIPYIRIWSAELRGKKASQIDVGSHTEFFYTVPELHFLGG